MPKGKVITDLESRREIGTALEALSRARTEEDGRPYLLALADFGAAVLPVVTRYLDTPDPWMVRALGRVLAQVKDRQRAAGALRRAILSSKSSDRRRIVAMVLLDQFLDQPLDEALFTALGNPAEVAVQALLRDHDEKDRVTCLDYLSILHAQQVQEIHFALDRFREAASRSAIDALRFFALDEREGIAGAALEALGTIRRPEALEALRIVEPNAPSFRRDLVERMQRKLLLSGMPDAPRPECPPGARVLVSPIDGAGNRLLLFLFPEEETYQVLHVFLDDDRGVRGAYEIQYVGGELPPPAREGTVHPAPHPWEGIFLLESTWGHARRLLETCMTYSEARGAFSPLEYRFFCDRIWAWSVPEEEPPELPVFQGTISQYEVSALLGHRYMVSWFLESEVIERTAQRLEQADLSRVDGQSLLALATVSLVQEELPAAVCLQYVRRLRDMAEWLVRAGDLELAAIAAAAAQELDTAQPLSSIFAMLLVQKGLLVAVGNSRQRGDTGKAGGGEYLDD